MTDIYQLGTVFYELFTGQPPFEGEPTQAMHQVLNEVPMPPIERADIPPEVDEILRKALAKSKADRHESVLYLGDALQAVFDEH